MDLAHDVFDRKHEEHMDAELLETVLTSLLAMYPEAPVAAHRADGVMAAMPDSVPLRRNPVLKARSGLDLIMHDDCVLKGWERVLAEGPPGTRFTRRASLTSRAWSMGLTSVRPTA
jgi:hypothetical protein